MADAEAALPLEVDLPSQRVVRTNGEAFPFEIDEFRKHCLVNGLDDIGLTLQKARPRPWQRHLPRPPAQWVSEPGGVWVARQAAAISVFEAKHASSFPWLRGIALATDAAAPVAR